MADFKTFNMIDVQRRAGMCDNGSIFFNSLDFVLLPWQAFYRTQAKAFYDAPCSLSRGG